MELTEAQRFELFDAYWSCQPCTCPACGKPLQSKHANVLGGYVLTFRCPGGCAVSEQTNADDPRAGEFRDWTDTEKMKLLGDFTAKRDLACPVCAVAIIGQSKWVFSGQLVTLRCDRCRKTHEDTIAR